MARDPERAEVRLVPGENGSAPSFVVTLPVPAHVQCESGLLTSVERAAPVQGSSNRAKLPFPGSDVAAWACAVQAGASAALTHLSCRQLVAVFQVNDPRMASQCPLPVHVCPQHRLRVGPGNGTKRVRLTCSQGCRQKGSPVLSTAFTAKKPLRAHSCQPSLPVHGSPPLHALRQQLAGAAVRAPCRAA